MLVGRAVRRRHGGLIRTRSRRRTRGASRASETAALEALALVGLAQVADVPTPELTSSQRRLVALAAALATEPQVLLVDELAAGAGADSSTASPARSSGSASVASRCSSSSTTCGLVRRVADRVLVLGAGTIVAEGSVAEVAASGVVQRAYLGTARL